MTYSLDGFRSLRREGVRLTAGFTAKIDIVLKLGSLNETITVSAASPVVDVASTKPTTSLTRETLELIPTSRNGVQAMLAQTSGVRSNLDVGGNTAGAIPQFRAFGQVSGSWPVVEGVAIAAPASAFSQPGNFRFLDHKVAVGADIFNLLNVNTVTSITTRSGASYGAGASDTIAITAVTAPDDLKHRLDIQNLHALGRGGTIHL